MLLWSRHGIMGATTKNVPSISCCSEARGKCKDHQIASRIHIAGRHIFCMLVITTIDWMGKKKPKQGGGTRFLVDKDGGLRSKKEGLRRRSGGAEEEKESSQGSLSFLSACLMKTHPSAKRFASRRAAAGSKGMCLGPGSWGRVEGGGRRKGIARPE